MVITAVKSTNAGSTSSKAADLLVESNLLHHRQVLLTQRGLAGSNGDGSTQLKVVNEPVTAAYMADQHR